MTREEYDRLKVGDEVVLLPCWNLGMMQSFQLELPALARVICVGTFHVVEVDGHRAETSSQDVAHPTSALLLECQ